MPGLKGMISVRRKPILEIGMAAKRKCHQLKVSQIMSLEMTGNGEASTKPDGRVEASSPEYLLNILKGRRSPYPIHISTNATSYIYV